MSEKVNSEAELNALEMAEYGRRIYLMRIQRRLSRAELAAKMGTSQEFIKKLENGKKYPTWKMAHRLADALETAISYFFDLGRSPRVITVYPTLEEAMVIAIKVMRTRKQIMKIPLDLLRALSDRTVQKRVREYLGLTADCPKYIQTKLESGGLALIKTSALERFPSVAKPKVKRRVHGYK